MGSVYAPYMGAHYYKPAAGGGYHKPKGVKAPKPASKPQYEWISRCIKERVIPAPLMARAVAALDNANLKSTEASALLTELLDLPRKPQVKPVKNHKPLPSVAPGYYAIETGAVGDLISFYRVKVVQGGKWDGRTFVDRVIGGHPDSAVYGAEARQVLEQIAADPAGASQLYAVKIKRCTACNRKLTDPVSRADAMVNGGYGPECKKAA